MKETFIIVAFIGGGFLLFMAFSMFRSLPQLSLNNNLNRQVKGSLFLSGILLSIANPYFTFWWATIGVSYLVQSMEVGAFGVIAFFTGHILGDLAWYSAVSLGVDKGKKFLNDGVYRKIVFVCALILLGFSIYFIWEGIDRIKDFL